MELRNCYAFRKLILKGAVENIELETSNMAKWS